MRVGNEHLCLKQSDEREKEEEKKRSVDRQASRSGSACGQLTGWDHLMFG